MSTQTLKLIKTDSEFLEVTATKVDDKWYYQPYWFEKIGDGLFIQHSFDNLPDELKSIIRGEREVLNQLMPEIRKQP